MVLPEPPRSADMITRGNTAGAGFSGTSAVSEKVETAAFLFVLGAPLLAGAGQAVHGGAAAGPVL